MASLEQILAPILKLQGIQSIFIYKNSKIMFCHSPFKVNENTYGTIECIINCYDVVQSKYETTELCLGYKEKNIIVQSFTNGYCIVIAENYLNQKLFTLALKPILHKISSMGVGNQGNHFEFIEKTLAKSDDSLAHRTIGGCVMGALIGKGGVGRVYKGVHLNMGMKVAVKILSPNYYENKDFVERFIQEGRVLARIEHPNIAKIINLGEEDGYHFLVMRYIEGKDLHSILHHQGPIDYKIVLSIAIDIAEGLKKVHELNIIHRDIKPSNIIIEKKTGIPILVDFGSVHKIDPDKEETKQNSIIGTPLYMSPEQCMGHSVEKTSDIYSLGATLYHLATGVPPFESPTSMSTLMAHIQKDVVAPHLKKDGIPEEFSEMISLMMHKKPEDRYQTVDKVISALKELKENKNTLHKVLTQMTKTNNITQSIKLKKYFSNDSNDSSDMENL